jgi:hypothetical protein
MSRSNYNTDQVLWDNLHSYYLDMETRGPNKKVTTLTVRDGHIHTGLDYVGRFSSSEDAEAVLEKAGFKLKSKGFDMSDWEAR